MNQEMKQHFIEFMCSCSDRRHSINAQTENGVKEKADFGRWSQAFLRQLALDVGMTKGSYNVRYNPAGVACSGDATLHHTKIYISFNCDLICDWILYRTCKGMKDYSGGVNRQMYWSQLITGYDNFVQILGGIITT